MMVKWSVCSDGRVKVMARADSVVMGGDDTWSEGGSAVWWWMVVTRGVTAE